MKCIAVFATVALTTLAVLEGADAQSSGSGSGPLECEAIGCSDDNPPNPVCGSDGVTYPNECELSIVCKKEKVTLAYKGACLTGSGSGPLECEAIGCSDENAPNPVCGSDGVTYPNECELSIVCKREKVTLAYKGACSGSKANSTEETEPSGPKVPAPTPAPTKKSAASKPLLTIGVTAVAAVVATVALM